MDPFNIKVSYQDQVVSLTILPETAYYKIIYYGAIVGAVRKVASDWKAVPAEEIAPGDLPLYDYKQSNTAEQPNFKLDNTTIIQIGKEIELKIS